MTKQDDKVERLIAAKMILTEIIKSTMEKEEVSITQIIDNCLDVSYASGFTKELMFEVANTSLDWLNCGMVDRNFTDNTFTKYLQSESCEAYVSKSMYEALTVLKKPTFVKELGEDKPKINVIEPLR